MPYVLHSLIQIKHILFHATISINALSADSKTPHSKTVWSRVRELEQHTLILTYMNVHTRN